MNTIDTAAKPYLISKGTSSESIGACCCCDSYAPDGKDIDNEDINLLSKYFQCSNYEVEDFIKLNLIDKDSMRSARPPVPL